MLRFLTCAAAIFVLVLSMCLLPQTAAARRCGVKEPETLLSLYQNSEAIYVATFDRTVEGKVVEDTDDYTAVEIKKHFTISSTLKGKSRKFFVLEEQDYRYKAQNVVGMAVVQPDSEAEIETAAETGSEEEPEPDEEAEDESELKSGDTLLLFVAKGGEGEPETLADYRDGIKKLSMEHIGVYEARIKELNAIFSTKKVNAERLLAWVIRTAEDPVTRWEGTYELLSSVRNAEWREETAKRRKEQIERGELVDEMMSDENGEPADEVAAEEKQFDTSVFATMLNHDHKQTMANILLNSYTPSSDPKKAEMVKGDDELIELVKRWGDPRLIGFLLDQLRTGSDDNAVFNGSAMSIVAEILEDDDAASIAEKYSSNSYEDGTEQVEAEEESEEAEPADEQAEKEKSDSDETPADPDVETTQETPEEPAEAEEPEEPVKRQITYAQLRAEFMQKFLAQCDKAIARREEEKHAETAR